LLLTPQLPGSPRGQQKKLMARATALEEAARKILRREGYAADGRRLGSVSYEQRCFERRMPKAPFRGKSTKR